MLSSIIPLFSATAANAGLDFATPLKAVLDSHWYVLGNEVKLFEEEFAAYVGVQHCISVANGSDALELALKGLGVVGVIVLSPWPTPASTAAPLFTQLARLLCTRMSIQQR